MPRACQKVLWLGRFQHDKQNKQIIFLNKYINVAYAINPNVNMTLMIEFNCEKKMLKI
jgi:hypothetical protein